MKVGFSIIADRRREEWVESLAAQLPDPFISWDRKQSVWDTAYRAWEVWENTDTDWAVVLEDDAVLTADFIPYVLQALRVVTHYQSPIPHSPVSFYLGSTRPEPIGVTWAVTNNPDASFYTHYRINHGVAVAIPTYLIDGVLEVGDQRTTPEYPFRLSKWFEQNRIRCWYTNPSLVDHRDMGSLINPSSKPRRAHRFVGERESVNWLREVVKLPRQ